MNDDPKRELLSGRRSTRLLPRDQVERTLLYAEHRLRGEFEFAVIGVVRQSTRLFNVGDVVTLFTNNGEGSRWPVYAVSSKGYTVFGLHLHFQAFVWRRTRSLLGESLWLTFPRRVNLIYDGPEQALHARQVLDQWKAAPARHREIVDTLRAAVAERR